MKIDKNNLIENIWILLLIGSVLLVFTLTSQCADMEIAQNAPETLVEATGAHETIEEDVSESTIIDIVTGTHAETEGLVEIETVEPVETEKLVEIETAEPEIEKFYTDEDAFALAKMVCGEARGMTDLWTWHGTVSGKAQQAACIWTVLNRYDAGYGDSIIAVLSAPYQYAGYNSSYPVDEEYLELARDVLDRWNREKNGETDVGRVIPSDYFWFRGDGKHNYFRNEFNGWRTWDWRLEDPYKEG